jgi:hypothetical protein
MSSQLPPPSPSLHPLDPPPSDPHRLSTTTIPIIIVIHIFLVAPLSGIMLGPRFSTPTTASSKALPTARQRKRTEEMHRPKLSEVGLVKLDDSHDYEFKRSGGAMRDWKTGHLHYLHVLNTKLSSTEKVYAPNLFFSFTPHMHAIMHSLLLKSFSFSSLSPCGPSMDRLRRPRRQSWRPQCQRETPTSQWRNRGSQWLSVPPGAPDPIVYTLPTCAYPRLGYPHT